MIIHNSGPSQRILYKNDDWSYTVRVNKMCFNKGKYIKHYTLDFDSFHLAYDFVNFKDTEVNKPVAN